MSFRYGAESHAEVVAGIPTATENFCLGITAGVFQVAVSKRNEIVHTGKHLFIITLPK